MDVYDAIIIGLGGMGSSAAYHLARRGARVLGIEQFEFGHDHGSSHGHTRIIRQAYAEGTEYVPLLLRAYELWRTLEHETGTRLLRITGAIYMGGPEAQVVTGAARSARSHGIPHEMLTAVDLRERYPVLHPPNDYVALYEPGAGILVPEQCVVAHLEMAKRCGADLHANERVVSWEADRHRVSVRTPQGTYLADHLVITAGPWTSQVLSELQLPLEVRRVVMYWLEPRSRLDEFKRLPIYVWEEHDILAYGFPYIEGQGLKCAFHQAFDEPTTPQTIRREVDEGEKERIRGHLGILMPDAAGPVRATATCMYTNTPDQHFIIDRHPLHDNVVFACGFSGHGFKFCSVMGEILADLVLRGTTEHPIGPFALRRFHLSA